MGKEMFVSKIDTIFLCTWPPHTEVTRLSFFIKRLFWNLIGIFTGVTYSTDVPKRKFRDEYPGSSVLDVEFRLVRILVM